MNLKTNTQPSLSLRKTGEKEKKTQYEKFDNYKKWLGEISQAKTFNLEKEVILHELKHKIRVICLITTVRSLKFT